jgi:chromosome segregation ATPase
MENNIATEIVEAPIAKTVTPAPKKTVRKTTAAKKPVAKKVSTKKVVSKTSVPKAVKMSGASNEIKEVVSSTVKDITKKVDFSKNVDKVKTSVKTLNEQLVSSTSDIYNEVVDMNKEIADIAVKSVKEMVSNFDIKEEVEKIKTSATELNSQVSAKAEELKSTTAKLAKDMMDNIKINERLATVKDAVKNSNKYALEATENAIDNVEKNATEWQKLTEKAVKKGFKLATKQQELVFETLEEVKNQVVTTRKNFKSLFSSNKA